MRLRVARKVWAAWFPVFMGHIKKGRPLVVRHRRVTVYRAAERTCKSEQRWLHLPLPRRAPPGSPESGSGARPPERIT